MHCSRGSFTKFHRTALESTGLGLGISRVQLLPENRFGLCQDTAENIFHQLAEDLESASQFWGHTNALRWGSLKHDESEENKMLLVYLFRIDAGSYVSLEITLHILQCIITYYNIYHNIYYNILDRTVIHHVGCRRIPLRRL